MSGSLNGSRISVPPLVSGEGWSKSINAGILLRVRVGSFPLALSGGKRRTRQEGRADQSGAASSSMARNSGSHRPSESRCALNSAQPQKQEHSGLGRKRRRPVMRGVGSFLWISLNARRRMLSRASSLVWVTALKVREEAVQPAGDQVAGKTDFAVRRVAAVAPVIGVRRAGAVIEKACVDDGGLDEAGHRVGKGNGCGRWDSV